jgi:multidrug efflux pump subunit AcrA (membrane-fusion protein)
VGDRRFPRWARWTALGCAAAVIGASTYLVVDALPSQAATAGLRTATVATGSVTQSISLSGSVERVDQVTAAFRTGGTVTSVKVSVGDEVEAGDVLATIGTADLERAVTVAQANLVSAQAALDAAGSSTGSASASSTSTGASTTPPASAPTASAGSSGSGGSGSSPPAPRVDTSPVHEAVDGYDALVQAAVVACQPVIDAGSTPEPTPTPTPTPTPSPSPSESSTPDASPSPSPSDEPSASSPTPTPDTTPSPSSDASGAAVVPAGLAGDAQDADGPTPEQVSACVKALSAALTSGQHAASAMDQLAKALDAATKALQEQQSRAGSTGSGSQPTGTGEATGGSATGAPGGSGAGPGQSTATLEVEVLQATQELATAEQDLDGAVLKAPISGTVGQVDLVTGGTASTSSGVVVVGPGAAVVTVDLPLAQLGKVRVSQDVVVTPAGTTDEVPGLVQSIGVLPSSTTSSTPSYPVRVTVSDAPVTLASGSTATATITLATAGDVLTVPVSAVTGVSSGRGSVQVVSGDVVTTAAVTVGAVGGGKVQVEQGLTEGQVVVLADPTTALPSSDDTNRFRRSTSGVGGLTGQGGPGGGLGGPPPG